MNWTARMKYALLTSHSTKRRTSGGYPSQPIKFALDRGRTMERCTSHRATILIQCCRLFAYLLVASLLVGQVAQVTAQAQDEDMFTACERIEAFDRLPFAVPAEPQSIKSWNILLYLAADFDEGRGFNPLEQFASYVNASSNTNVLILEDKYSFRENDVIWSVTHEVCNLQVTPVLDLGEAETDKPETLERFLRFAQEWFPSERTLLFMYGHGGAWLGACTDESSAQEGIGYGIANRLSPTDMRSALEAVGGVDALMFSAPCSMSSLETAYELRDVTDLYVADEETSGYVYWREAVGCISRLLKSDPNLDIETLGTATIDAVRETTLEVLDAGHLSHLITNLPPIAAIRTSSLADLASAVDAFAEAVLSLPEEMHEALLDLRARQVPHFSQGELADVYGLAEACQTVPTLSEAASTVMQAVDEAVIALLSPGAMPQGEATGLSLFFPTPVFKDIYKYRGHVYLNYDLSLSTDTHWDEMIEALFGPPPIPE